MKRRHRKQTASFEERLADQARRAREQAKRLPPGIEREEFLRKARQAETASQINDWLTSATVSK
jgi:hypothetical protein